MDKTPGRTPAAADDTGTAQDAAFDNAAPAPI